MKSEEKSRDSSVENEKSHPLSTRRHQRPVQRLKFFFHEIFYELSYLLWLSSLERVVTERSCLAIELVRHVSYCSTPNYSSKQFLFKSNYSVILFICSYQLHHSYFEERPTLLSIYQASQRRALLQPSEIYAYDNKLMLPTSRGIREFGRLSG